MHLTNDLPSIEELITSGDPSQVRRERPIIKFLNAKFSGSIAPLLLLTRESLPEIKGLGPRSVRLIVDRMAIHDLRARDYEEPAEKRAALLYGTIHKAPIQALYVFSVSYGTARFTHYVDSRVVSLLCRLDPSMTLGELTEMSRTDLRKYLKMKGVVIETHIFDQFVRELRNRLKCWGLALVNEYQRKDTSTVDR